MRLTPATLAARMRARMPGRGSLGWRTVIAGGWMFAQLFALHVLRLISNLIMTRLLLPEAFGVMAMIVTVHGAINLFTDIGIRRSISREPDGDTTEFLRTAWVVKIGRGMLVAVLIVVAAVLLWALGPRYAAEGTVYADPRLPGLLALSSLSVVFNGVGSTAPSLSGRKLHYGLLTFQAVAAQIAGLVAMVGFAQIEASPRALVAGLLVNSLTATILSHTIFPGPKMRFYWDSEIASRLWHFGKWIIGASALQFIARTADRLILGALLPAEMFGIYVIATLWVDAGRKVINRLADRLSFPVFNEISRKRPDEIGRLFRKFLRVIDMMCLAGFAGFALFGQQLIEMLYTPDYAQAGLFLTFLALSYLTLRFSVFGSLLLSTGDSRAMMVVSGIRAVTICVGLPLGYRALGIEGALLATALTPLSAVPYLLWRLRPVLGRDRLMQDLAWLAAPFLMAVGLHLVYGAAFG